MKEEKVDVIIVGTGVAGLFCALHIPKGKKVLMLTKDSIENSDSYLAQGGISTLKNEADYESYFKDTLKAGRYENNKKSVEVMIKSSPEIIKELIALGVDFDRGEDGLCYTREGAHSTYRILHHKDITGKEITSTLLEQVKKLPHVEIKEYTTMIDILKEEKVCKGIVMQDKRNNLKAISAKVVVWATGGIGGLFENSTNFKHITGDSVAIALKHHIAVKDVNYIQIHPTSLYSKKSGRRFLISEAVRGEGAYLLNPAKERFVDELLPRDVVSLAIHDQMNKYRSEYVYLTLIHMGSEKIKKRFPNIYKRCLEEGYDITCEMIPVTPAQHYFMGGVEVDREGQTSLSNLFAIGETSCNGVHGANRLASNSLLESLVFAKRAAQVIKDTIESIPLKLVEVSLEAYNDTQDLQETYKKLILEEIKRRDEKFYDKWCNNAYQCG